MGALKNGIGVQNGDVRCPLAYPHTLQRLRRSLLERLILGSSSIDSSPRFPGSLLRTQSRCTARRTVAYICDSAPARKMKSPTRSFISDDVNQKCSFLSDSPPLTYVIAEFVASLHLCVCYILACQYRIRNGSPGRVQKPPPVRGSICRIC